MSCFGVSKQEQTLNMVGANTVEGCLSCSESRLTRRGCRCRQHSTCTKTQLRRHSLHLYVISVYLDQGLKFHVNNAR